MLLPQDGKELNAFGLEAMEAGIPVVNLDRAFPDAAAYRLQIKGDNYGMGVAAGHYIGEQLKAKGVANPIIGEIAGIDELELTQERSRRASRPHSPSLRLQGRQPPARPSSPPTPARRRRPNLLQALPKMDALWNHDDDQGIGVLAAIKQANRKRVLHGRRRRLARRRWTRHQGRQHGAEGDGHLQPVDGVVGDLAGPARSRQGKGMGDLVELQVPKEIILASETITKDNASRRTLQARVLSSHREETAPCPLGRRRAAGRHGRLRVHGRRALAGVAHREPRLRPAARARMVAGLRPRRGEGGGRRRPARLGRRTPPTGASWSPGTTSTSSTSAPRATATPRSRIAALAAGKHVLCEKPLANTVAEARGDGRRGGQGPGAGRPVDVRVQLPPGARRRADAAAGRGRPARRDPARPRRLPAGLDHRPAVPAGLAAAEGEGRLRRARRHRRAHHRPDPVRHRPADHRCQRAHRDVRQGASAAGGVQRAARPTAPVAATGQVTVDDAARLRGPARRRRRWPRTRRPASPPAARTALRVEINGSLGSLVFDLERLNELEFYDATRPGRRAGLHAGSW